MEIAITIITLLMFIQEVVVIKETGKYNAFTFVITILLFWKLHFIIGIMSIIITLLIIGKYNEDKGSNLFK